MKQTPFPGERLIRMRGDSIVFTLELYDDISGQAFLRTNLGHGAVRRNEIIAHTEQSVPVLETDWHDLPMRRIDSKHFQLVLPLVEVGNFEAKAWFQPDNGGRNIWVGGEDNTFIKVEPAGTVCANTIYTLFTRQFGSNKYQRNKLEIEFKEPVADLDKAGYAVIPPSGTFRDVIKELDFIIGKLRSRIIQLLPIHPVPTTYARMGRYGSPFAAIDFFSVDPAYAEFDTKSTPLEQFQELVDAIHARNARVFIDIPVNHTGWASQTQMAHPEWFERLPDKTFVSPGAWGTVWADLCKLNYRLPDVHSLMAEVFLYWCRRGVDGFRCDAGYMLPFEAWVYIVAKVRNEYPDTVFLLEGLGGPLDKVHRLLGEAGLNWAYSELFQNYSREQIGSYLPLSNHASMNSGVEVHFAETHDNNRLASTSAIYARMRTAMCAMFSHNGAFGITNGVEWLANFKVIVHGAEPLNWGSPENQVDAIRRLHALLEYHPAFWAGARLELIQQCSDNALALLRCSADGKRKLLVLVNLNDAGDASVCWPLERFGNGDSGYADLIAGQPVKINSQGNTATCRLTPGTVMCLCPGDEYERDMDMLRNTLNVSGKLPERVLHQECRATIMDIIADYQGFADISGWDIDGLAHLILDDPMAVCRRIFNTDMPPVTLWHDGRDQKRRVMVPQGDMLLLKSDNPFRVEVKSGERTVRAASSMPCSKGGFFVLLTAVKGAAECIVKLTTFGAGRIRHTEGVLLFMHRDDGACVNMEYTAEMVASRNIYALCTTRLGGMSQARGAWGELHSKYDAFLAGNLNPDYPVDRTVMFTRCRAWMVYKDYSREINLSCLKSFRAGLDNRAQWEFFIPVGQGRTVELRVTLALDENANFLKLNFERLGALHDGLTALDDDESVKIILRPDVEDRSNHCVTKAYLGPEVNYHGAVAADPNGFSFNPTHSHALVLNMKDGRFVHQPEWHYMIHLREEEQRGLDAHTDLFSPGYFEFMLHGGENRVLTAEINCGTPRCQVSDMVWANTLVPHHVHVKDAFLAAMRHFVVKRDDSRTVIAGYPWFLDWGRDTLICLRGLIAAGWRDETIDIIRVFAGFEKQGTLPNMIRGNDDSNRDTSDAPLWLFVAVGDCMKKDGTDKVLTMDCRGRTLLQVLVSIAENYIKGTPNGIRMDAGSGLIFSPSHFTWMDTNHPAGSPREGYPVEIQALWFYALNLLAECDGSSRWRELALQVKESITNYYPFDNGGLSDCLHCGRGVPALSAAKDDACRSNQLLAITLGAITDRKVQHRILADCEELLIPGAIRSLADRPVNYLQPVYRNGSLLNDPKHPYWGRYEGDEDTRRKPAYHNGTAWTWPFPSYCEAMLLVGGDAVRDRAMALLTSGIHNMENGCPGHTPEVLDGNVPHALRGCGAQAWGVTELYRVYTILSDENKK